MKELNLEEDYFRTDQGPSSNNNTNNKEEGNGNQENVVPLNNSAVSVGIAISGGGYRAMLTGAGVLKALDSRTADSSYYQPSLLKGLLDGATYLSGLSGSGWLITSLYHNNFRSIDELINPSGDFKIWNLQNHMLFPDGKGLYFDDANDSETASYMANAFRYYTRILAQVTSKRVSGFPVTITDIYGRLLTGTLLAHGDGDSASAGLATQWSDIATYSFFKQKQAPYPIIMALARRSPGEDEAVNSTTIEITPHELGSFDPALHAFADLKYLGTPLDNNRVITKNRGDAGQCVSGLDNVGFIAGTTSSLFDRMIQMAINSTRPVTKMIGSLMSAVVDPTNLDVAEYAPNPFYHYQNPTYAPTTDFLTSEKTMHLVDGGLSGENVPLWPLIYKPRGIDMILAVDNSDNSDIKWPTGRSLIDTYLRASGKIADTEEGQTSNPGQNGKVPKHYMPRVPDENSFVNLGFTTRPVFFGCYASDYLSDQQVKDRDLSTAPPLIVYLANAPMSYKSNISHFKLQYNVDQMNKMIQNGYDLATQLGDKEWPKCVACATIQRQREKQGLWDPTDECQQCFDQYCWDEKTVDTRDYVKVGAHYNPNVKKT